MSKNVTGLHEDLNAWLYYEHDLSLYLASAQTCSNDYEPIEVCPDVMPDMNFAQEDAEWYLENGGAAKNMLLKYFYGVRYEMTPEDINAVVYSINM